MTELQYLKHLNNLTKEHHNSIHLLKEHGTFKGGIKKQKEQREIRKMPGL